MLPELPHDPTLDATAHDIRRAIFRCWMAHKYDRVGFLAAINEEAAARRLPDVAAAPGVKAWVMDALEEQDFIVEDEPYRTHR